jgi:cytochrome P450/nitrite reductase/ring-hydroxylating ferredoxin subunit
MPDLSAPIPAPPPHWEKVAARLEGRGPLAASAGGVDVVVLRTPAGLRAFEGRCPHQGALLGEGELDGGELVCRNHGFRFDADTGARVRGRGCLRACPVREEADGSVLVDASSLRAGVATPKARRKLADLPGPRGLPLLGNALEIDLPRMHAQLEAWSARFGALYTIGLGPRRVLVVSDQAMIEGVLRARPETFRRESRLEPVFEEMRMPGVFSAEGAAWRAQRRLMMDALSQKNVRSFYPTLRSVAGRLRARWERAAAAGTVVDVKEDLKRFTVDVTTLLAFGRDVDTLGGGDDVIQRHLELVFPAIHRRLYAVAPTWRWVKLAKDRELDRALDAVLSFLRELTVEARARLAAEPARPPANFLEAMLTAQDERGEPFPDEIVLGNALQILLAGEDTTANTIAWAMHELARAPDAVAALRAEADELLGDDPVARDADVAARLAFAGAVANEAMRLRPVAPVFFLSTNTDTTIGDVEVPAGAAVALLVRVPAIDDRKFEGGARFSPSRWLSPPAVHDPGASVPFGSGPRICPGRSLAMLEMRMVLAMIYRCFEVLPEPGPVTERLVFTLEPAGLEVRLRARA